MKTDILKAYKELEIKNKNDLYEFILNNRKATINERVFNFSKSNQVMEFMALFLEASGFQVTRLFFEKTNSTDSEVKYRHWLVMFSDGEKWYYFEPFLKNHLGQYRFDSYNEITFFISKKLNDVFENPDNPKYTLYEIKPLENFNYEKNIKQSKEGTEIFISDSLDFDIKDDASLYSERENIYEHKNEYLVSLRFFLIAFAITVVVCLLVLWATTTIDKYF